MVAALSTVVVLLLIGAATIHLAYLEKMISRRYVEYLQASYLAESGIESARAAMFNDPGVLSSPETTFHLEIVQPDLVGSAEITVTQPLFDGLLIVKSTGQTSGGAKRIWQADMTAPPGYEVYCEKFSLNPELDISFILQTFGINHPESGRPLQGALHVDPRCRAACQELDAGEGSFQGSHTRRYQPAGPVDMKFWSQAAESERLNWGGYSYHYSDGSIVLPPVLRDSIYAVNGDVLLYSGAGGLNLQNCLVIAAGDIWVVNMEAASSRVTGLYRAGGDINLYQAKNDMEVRACLCAGRNVNICCGGSGDRVYLQSVEAPEFFRRLPPVIRGKMGFLTIRSYQEMVP